ncbi:tRNA (adenosine(37)-N6)-dimethylallyltransferase MiaA [Candidatus Dependentiae bacterium]|nr:tRNA (adenosine(37)-N6)-dimethylallyltransferase MiaA [Candidatus Dependentiae bacterium]
MIVIITGPTASGKTALSEQLVPYLQGAVINADMGQFYTALTIGTAKPDWQALPFDSYLFDWVDTPRDITVVAFKKAVDDCVLTIQAAHKTPLIVGGSSFYIKSLFYPPQQVPFFQTVDMAMFDTISAAQLWEQLYAIDPERAQAIHATDHYRLTRALALWYGTGQKPSTLKPSFVMPYKKVLLVVVLPARAVLTERINMRNEQMIKSGWIEEAQSLISTDWQSFVQEKKLVGYTELLAWLMNGAKKDQLSSVINAINIQTRQYAKRQETFLNKLAKEVAADAKQAGADLQIVIAPDNSLQTVEKIVELAK